MNKYTDKYYKIPYWIMQLKHNQLSAPLKVMLMVIYGLSQKEGFCYAKNSTLAKRTGLSESSISTHLKKLEEKEFIHRIYTDKYRKLIPILPGSKIIPLDLAKKVARLSNIY